MSGLDEKGRYCTCNSKTNPCVVCSKPKFIDPEWLKRKIEEEPDGMEVGAGFEIFSTPDTVAATPADVGELVERLREKANKLDDMQGFSAPSGKLEREAATALERVVRERDNLQARLTARAKSMLRLRETLAGVHDNIEDEGDRTYFGSTNDADTFREVWQDLDAWAWDDIMSDGKMTDVYAVSREAHTRSEVAEAKLAEARKELGHTTFKLIADAYGLNLAHELERNGWEWPDDAPQLVNGTIGEAVKHLRAARRFLEETK